MAEGGHDGKEQSSSGGGGNGQSSNGGSDYNKLLNREMRNLFVNGEFKGIMEPPEKRNRLKTKRFRPPKEDVVKKIGNVYYDEEGKFLVNEVDLCDCLEEKCPGCFNECKKCHGRKCSYECRALRDSYIESIENEGRETVLKVWFNPDVKNAKPK